jgi:hypothetical protein
MVSVALSQFKKMGNIIDKIGGRTRNAFIGLKKLSCFRTVLFRFKRNKR